MELVHKTKKSTCTTCNKEISVKHFAEHFQTHLPEVERRKFKCSVELCSKIYYSQGDLNKHVKNYHSPTPRIRFKCDLCPKEYYTKSDLKKHILRIHSGPVTKYGCTLCDAVFKSRSGRNYHVVATYTGEKAFPCEECPAKFPTAHHLKSHQLVHSDEKPHKCSICSKQFKRRGDLPSHIKHVHSQRTKDFSCSKCQKTFYTKSNLSKHAKTHCNGGDFACYFCKMKFYDRTPLDIHLRTHTEEKPFYCPDKSCQYSSASSSSLGRHQRCHHPSTGNQATPLKTWPCYFCSKIFPQSNKLVVHMRNHTLEEAFPCKLCKKSFMSGSHLRTHISTHTKEKPYSCPQCGKCFSQSGTLKSHMAIHTGEKRFFCEFCTYSSFGKGDFVRHLSSRHKNFINL